MTGAQEPAVPAAAEPAEFGQPDQAAGSGGGPAANTVVSGVAYGLLQVAGLLAGVLGSFSYSWMLGPVPAAAIGLIAANFAGCWAAGRGMGGKAGAGVLWAGWCVAVIVLSTPRSAGDVIITGDGIGYLFLLGGMASGGLAVAVTRSDRPPGQWLLGGATHATVRRRDPRVM